MTIEAGANGWVMPRARGVAHLSVTVQSLFDGTVRLRESDESFDVSLSSIVAHDDGAIDITVSN